jgi:hypothetical protein
MEVVATTGGVRGVSVIELIMTRRQKHLPMNEEK